jgi:hypothetical protein
MRHALKAQMFAHRDTGLPPADDQRFNLFDRHGGILPVSCGAGAAGLGKVTCLPKLPVRRTIYPFLPRSDNGQARHQTQLPRRIAAPGRASRLWRRAAGGVSTRP